MATDGTIGLGSAVPQARLTAQDKAKLRLLCKQSLFFFASGVLFPDRPGKRRWLVPEVHGRLARFMECGGRFTGICAPRGFLKTTLGTVSFAVWRAIRNPEERILIVSNTETNAKGMIGQIKHQFESNLLLQFLFPEVIPNTFNKDWSNESLTLNRRGTYSEGTFDAAGVGTKITSRHYTIIIEDDTVAPRQSDMTTDEIMPTREDIEKAIGYHKTLYPQLADPSTGEIHIRGTRWAEFDLIGWLRDPERPDRRYKWLVFAATVNGMPEGPPIYPERFPRMELMNLRRGQGDWLFFSQYLNNPLSSDKCPFRQKWIRVTAEVPKSLNVYIGVDPAMSEAKTADYTVILTLGVDDHGVRYVLDYMRARITTAEVIDRIFFAVREAKKRGIFGGCGIEAVSYQRMLMQRVEEEMQERGEAFHVEPMNAGAPVQKPVRIQGLQPYFEKNLMYFARPMPELEAELVQFPFGTHDDTVDALDFANTMAERAAPKRVRKPLPDWRWDQHEDGSLDRVTGVPLDAILREIRARKRGGGADGPYPGFAAGLLTDSLAGSTTS